MRRLFRNVMHLPGSQGTRIYWVLLFFLLLYLATGVYCGYAGDALDYLCLALEPAQWHKLPVHVGYYALLHALTFRVSSFSQALIVQTLLSVAAGVAGLGALYGITRRIFPASWRGFSGDELALLCTIYTGICGGYWVHATTGEILGVQHAAVLLACHFFLTGRDWRGAGCFFVACAVSPLAALAAPGALLLRVWGGRTQPRSQWRRALGAATFWAVALLVLYARYHLIPGIDYRVDLRAGIANEALGHGLPPALITWPEAVRKLSRVYLRAALVLLPLGAVGLAAALASWRAFGVWLGLAGLWILAHLLLLPRLPDVWSHSSIWFVLLAGFAALGTAVASQWLGRHGFHGRRALAAALILTQFATTAVLWTIPVYQYSLDNRHSGQRALQLSPPDAVWVGALGTRRILELANPANRPGQPLSLKPVAADCLDLKNIPVEWDQAGQALRQGHPVFAIINNRRALGPVLKYFLNADLPLPEGGSSSIRLDPIAQTKFFGIYRLILQTG